MQPFGRNHNDVGFGSHASRGWRVARGSAHFGGRTKSEPSHIVGDVHFLLAQLPCSPLRYLARMDMGLES